MPRAEICLLNASVPRTPATRVLITAKLRVFMHHNNKMLNVSVACEIGKGSRIRRSSRYGTLCLAKNKGRSDTDISYLLPLTTSWDSLLLADSCCSICDEYYSPSGASNLNSVSGRTINL